ncbi:putative mannose-1-phosphate guanylyltransferase [Wolbachia endosymbiont of Wuchereria bancrofti]|nr:putative mannose-1-phosphate guanylyltransferase [Wolbachia endosymbiont of Wuchereria bancrofti]
MPQVCRLQEYKVIFGLIRIGTAVVLLILAFLCDKNETMLILPSIYFIGGLNNFYTSVEKASQLASELTLWLHLE